MFPALGPYITSFFASCSVVQLLEIGELYGARANKLSVSLLEFAVR